MNVRVCFDDDNATGFSYDADSGLYRMLHADGTPQLDANNGQQAGFDNLLVLFSASELRDDGKTYDYDLSMGGGVWGPSPGRRAGTTRCCFTTPMAAR